jgi:hypothetical protein
MGRADLDVLIVDDNEIVAEAIADGVRLAGYTVCGVASTAERALELALGPITIIFVTGYPDKMPGTDIGVAWMEKPYRVLDLINALEIVTAVTEHRAVTLPMPPVLHLLQPDHRAA